jgi:predicted  nucleic acid-binding Zn-ribbon protein
MTNEQKLLRLKKKIDTAKEKVSELKGQRIHLEKELKEKWGCNTIKEAREKIEKIEESIEKMEKQIKEGIKELEDKYDF